MHAAQAANAAEAKEMYLASLRRPQLVAQVVPSPITFKYDATIQDVLKRGVLGELVYIEVMPQLKTNMSTLTKACLAH